MVINPLNNYIIIEPVQQDEHYNDELEFLSMPPSEFVGVPTVGVVKYIGTDHPSQLELDDKIVFDQPNPHGFWLNGLKLQAVKPKEVLGVIE